MGEVTPKLEGWNSKICALFNNEMFSDVQFIIGKDANSKLYGHKLILALRSEYFASSFHDKKVLQLNIEADEKALYLTMLKFLYTDKLELSTSTEAKGLLSLAKQFSIKDLEKECIAFLLKDVTANNVFEKYEYALSKNIESLLHVYRQFVCDKAEVVLNSGAIGILSADSLEDILKLENLKVSSEMVVLKALLRWAEMQNDKPDDHALLKRLIFPFLKHIRFLTLTENEFQSFLEAYDILSGLESLVLTKKILKPDDNVKIPNHICSINYKRGSTVTAPQTSVETRKKFLDAEAQKDLKLDSDAPNFVVKKYDPTKKQPLLPTPPSNQMIQVHASNQNKSSGESKNSFKNPSKPHDWSKVKYNFSSSIDDLVSKNVESIDASKKNSDYLMMSSRKELFSSNQKEALDRSGKISYEIKKQHSFTESQHPISKKAFDNYHSVPKLCNFSSEQSSVFEFPLDDSRHGLDLSFKRDIECSVSFEMKYGSLKISGFELFIKNASRALTETIQMEVDFAGFSESSLLLKKELAQNVLQVRFPKPVALNGTKGKLTVSVDELYGNRCRLAKTKVLEMNRGPNWACNLIIDSNQKVEQNLLFLINKLFYSQ